MRERRHALLDHLGDRLELGQPLDARLRLRGLAGLGPEAIDEALQMRAFGLLLGPGRGLQPGLFGAPRFEIVVAAGVKLELAFAQMQDGVDRIVQKLAVVADDHGGMRIFLQPRFEPQRALEIEIVGGLVEQQQIGLREQRRGERHAHAPAAGKFRHRPMRSALEKPSPLRISAARAGAPIGIDRVRVADRFRRALRARRFPVAAFSASRSRIGGQNRVQEPHRRRGMLLIDRSDPGGFRQQNFAALRHEIAQ